MANLMQRVPTMSNKMLACRYPIQDVKAGFGALRAKTGLWVTVFSLTQQHGFLVILAMANPRQDTDELEQGCVAVECRPLALLLWHCAAA